MGRIDVLPDDQIEALLRTAVVARIACCDHSAAGGRPYLVPLAYAYDGDALYAHSGPGRKLAIMRSQPLVTIEVDQVEAADRWRSVVAEGTFEEVREPAAAGRAIRLLYPAPAPIPELGLETVVFRIKLTAKSGRYEVPEP